MKLLRTVLSNGPIARVIAAWASLSLGWWAFSIVLSLYAYRSGGASAVALALTVRMLPSALAAPYTSMLADRHARRTVMLVSASLTALLLAAVAAAASVDAPLGIVLVLAAAATSVNTAYRPAQAALLAEMARTPAELGAGNVCVSTLESGGFLVGSLMAGVLAGVAGLDVAFAACAAAYVLSLLGLIGVPAGRRVAPSVGSGAVSELLAGVRAVVAHPDIRLLVGVFSFDALVQGAADVLLVVAAFELLGIGEEGVGWLNACWGIGGVVGGIAALGLLGRGRLALGLVGGLLLCGLPLALIGVWTSAAGAYPLLVLVGVGYALSEIALLTLTQRLASDDVLARVFGVEETAHVVATAVGALCAGALVGLLGARGAIVVVGLALPVLAVAVWRRVVGFSAGIHVPERAFALVRGLSLFAPLPLAMVETLAVRMEPREHPVGEAIIREGEDGDTFYVIADGTVEVQVDGVVRRQEGAGEFFGEIALLRDVPRTATVTALTPVTTLELGREDFLNGVGAHVRSANLAEAVVTERLAAPRDGAAR